MVETDQMYLNRKLAEYEATRLRPPITIRHDLPATFAAAPAAQEAAASSSSSTQQKQQGSHW